jgi:hypothetical protein
MPLSSNSFCNILMIKACKLRRTWFTQIILFTLLIQLYANK